MEIIFIASSILLTMAISLGVGSSTIAIANFFTAIADGSIEPEERRMIGVTYWVLRAAMVIIALALIVQYMLGYLGMESWYYGSVHAVAAGIITVVLYVNAALMTYRLMPSTFGPAIQASSWYALGVMAALIPLGITQFSLAVFLVCYVTAFVFALSLVNGIMGWLKHR